MKRSEMIEILNHYVVEKSGDCDGQEILEIVEKLGMTPPINDKLNPGTIMAGDSNKWEPEDNE